MTGLRIGEILALSWDGSILLLAHCGVRRLGTIRGHPKVRAENSVSSSSVTV
jgi:hypothetical protein